MPLQSINPHIILYGCNQKMMRIVSQLMKSNPHSRITLMVPSKYLGFNSKAMLNKLGIDEIPKIENYELFTLDQLRNMGISQIFTNVKVDNIDVNRKIISFYSKETGLKQEARVALATAPIARNLQFDYLVYGDVPICASRIKEIPDEAANVMYFDDPNFIESLASEYFHKFKSCTILGITDWSLELAMNLSTHGKTVHIISNKKSLLTNIWSNFVEQKIIKDLSSQRIHFIENPKKIEFQLDKKGQKITEMHYKKGQKVNTVKTDMVIVARWGKLEMTPSFIFKIAKTDDTYRKEYGVRRIITKESRINRSIFGFGLATVEENMVGVPNHFAKLMFEDPRKYEMIHNYLSRHKIISHLAKITGEFRAQPKSLQFIDEIVYEGEFYKHYQTGMSKKYITNYQKFNYGIFKVVDERNLWRGIALKIDALIDLNNREIKGVNLSMEGPHRDSLNQLFSEIVPVTYLFKSWVLQNISTDQAIQTNPIFISSRSSTKVRELLEKIYENLTRAGIE